MESKTYLYRRGNGNEGNYSRALVTLAADECPFSALRALVANDYIPGRRVRLHIMRSIVVDGDAEHGISAAVYEGPKGETEFGDAWITAELEPCTSQDVRFYEGQCLRHYKTLRAALDRGAWAYFKKGT